MKFYFSTTTESVYCAHSMGIRVSVCNSVLFFNDTQIMNYDMWMCDNAALFVRLISHPMCCTSLHCMLEKTHCTHSKGQRLDTAVAPYISTRASTEQPIVCVFLG